MNNYNWLRKDNIADIYHIISEVGSGTYGTVYKAQSLRDQTYVALKKFELFKEQRPSKDKKRHQYSGFPITAIREIKILEMVNHPNLIKLIEIISTKPSPSNNYKSSTFLVFEYMEHDFLGFLTQKISFTIPQIKCMLHQLLNGVAYLHSKNIMHRDIKAANILYNNQGQVKLADFGLGSINYTSAIDVWSIGCIFAELLIGQILFKGDKEVRQLELIQQLCGRADKYNWLKIFFKARLLKNHRPDVEKLPEYANLSSSSNSYQYKLREFIMQKRPDLQQNGFDLLSKMLVLDPKKRISCEEAMKHSYFSDSPSMCNEADLQKFPTEFHDTLLKQSYINKKSEYSQKGNIRNKLGLSNNKRYSFHNGKYFGFPQQFQDQNRDKKQASEQYKSTTHLSTISESNQSGKLDLFCMLKIEQIVDQSQVIQSSIQQNFNTSQQYIQKKIHSQKVSLDENWIFENILKKIQKN